MGGSAVRDHGSALAQDGAQRLAGAALETLAALVPILPDLPAGSPGLRIVGIRGLTSILETGGPIGALAAAVLGPAARPVRAVLFDKRAEANWSLGWHQDRTIAVDRKAEVAGFGPWTVKQGMQHVAPPFELIANMVTLRVHLDDVPETNAPLLIAPGSHRLGLIPIGDIAGAVRRCGTRSCIARAGDVWLYSTPILHASEQATRPARRRVLQIDYAACELPGGLEWLGV